MLLLAVEFVLIIIVVKHSHNADDDDDLICDLCHSLYVDIFVIITHYC